jgi:hypothetical protein
MKRSRWLQVLLASALVAGSLIFSASASFAAGTLSFVTPGPQDAAVAPTVITTSDFNTPAGGPIQVQISGGSQTATVTVAISPASPDADPAAVLGGTTQVRARNGVASFSDLTIDKHGTYKLVATSDNATPATSDAFRIWDAVCSNGGKCTAGQIVKTSVQDSDQESASTTAPTGQTVALSLGDENIKAQCEAVETANGVTANHGPFTTSLFATGGGLKTVTFIVSSFWDSTQGNPPGASFYEVCYVDEQQTWTDAFGNTISIGTASLLPDCSPSVDAPCVVSRTKESRSRNVKIVVKLRDSKMY